MSGLRVFAAGSLRPAFSRLEGEFTYANARELARRLNAGEEADVFAAPSAEHLRSARVDPRPFATNRLVVAVPVGSAASGPEVLATGRVVIEAAGIPLGDYTRELLAALGIAPDVVAEELIVDAVADWIIAGDADAGVLYATDVAARPGQLRAIEVPESPAVTLYAGVTRVARDPRAAAAWIDALTDSPALRDAGFGPA